MVDTMKSFNAGTECTLNEPLFCPDNGKTLKRASRNLPANYLLKLEDIADKEGMNKEKNLPK